jgi:membrane associated rhomboid family serine protease
MREVRYTSQQRSMLGGSLTPAVKWLLITTTATYLGQFVVRQLGFESALMMLFALTPALAAGQLYVWQVFTYMFLHSTSDPSHLLLNMLGLWMFGSQLERVWGTRKFLFFYFTCGIFGGLCVVLAGAIFPSAWVIPTIGQSGAIYGLIAAFGLIFSEQQVYFYAIIPIKAKVFTWVLIGIAVLYALAGSRQSFPAHMGGLLCGWLLVTGNYRPKLWWLKLQYWRINRKKKKLRVIDGGGPYVH